MGFARAPLLLLLLLKLFLCQFVWLSLCQGEHSKAEFKYPFIKRASTFSSITAANSSDGRDGGAKAANVPAYDYIVVGGGTAGCPLAATLSQNFSVLVLERGGVPFHNFNVSFMQNFHISLADTSPSSASQPFVSTDGVINSRARILGGGSCINAGFYTRAGRRFVEKVGWDEKLVSESYPWVEDQIVYKPKLATWQRAVRDALLDVGVSPFNGFTLDHKSGTKVGGTIFDHRGRRHTAADLLASANPDNILVLIRATVQKILFQRTNGKRPKAVGVIFKDEKGYTHRATLSRRRESEVVVSCGAIGSPQLLMLSGVGQKEDLEKLNISVVHDNKFVGKDMVDNPLNTMFIPTIKPVQQSLIQTVGITNMGVYIEASSGFGQCNDSIQRHHGILSAEIGQLTTIPPRQRTKEAIQAYKARKQDLPFEAFMGGFIIEKLASPLSTGQLSLTNTNINENPKVTFNYFKHPYDLKRCVHGVQTMVKMVKSKHFTNFTRCDKDSMEKLLKMSVKANVNLVPRHPNDTKFLQQFCKDTVTTIWHYHGGCHVGKVVAPNYKVIGIDRLRVIDGSTFSQSPGTNPQATVMMLGRYMGVKMLRERLGKAANV